MENETKSEINIKNNNHSNNFNQATKKNNFKFILKLEERARNKLIKRYDKPDWFYNSKMINDILYNEKTHYVEMFKEYLLYEDYNEFLRQYYGKTILKIKLQKILNFYEKYSKIFPNYTALRESKYLYKNIKKKQKVINQIINENKRNENADDDSYSSYNKTIFNSRVINSIYTGHNTITVNKNNDMNLTNDKSISKFIEQISEIEKEIVKNNEQKKKPKDDKNNSKKNGQIIFKKLSGLLVNSTNLNYSNNANNFIKNRAKIDFKKNFLLERQPNINNKMILNPYNNISKQKSLSNIIYPNKKIKGPIKYDNNSNNLSKRGINNNSIMGKANNAGLKYYLDYEKYKKILLSTNSTNTPKIMPERMVSSPRRAKSIKFMKKRCVSNSKKNKNIYIKKINNNINFLNKNNISKNKRNTSNNSFLRDEKKLLKCQINKQNKNKLLNNFHPDSVNKYYSNNISNLSVKNKNTRKNNTFSNKNKIVNNYNIMNGIMNNSTQINIYTGNDLIKSLNLYWNSIINSTKTNSPLYDSNLSKKKLGTKTLSKKEKKIKNMKQFIEKHMKEKKMKEPYTERNSSNDKLLKLLDIYCREGKKHRNANIKKNTFNKNKLTKSHNYKTKNKSKYEEKSVQDFIYRKSNNIDYFRDKEKNNNSVINKKILMKPNKMIK